MANSMLESILGMVTPDMNQALASRLGESATGVQSGLSAATATTLSGLADKASDSGFLSQITGLLGGGTGQNILTSLPSIASSGPTGTLGDVINRFLPMVFGTQQGQVASAITQFAGLGSGSGLGLLKMAAPLVLGYFASCTAPAHSRRVRSPTRCAPRLRICRATCPRTCTPAPRAQ